MACALARETKTRLFVLHVLEPGWEREPVALGEPGPITAPVGGGDTDARHEAVRERLRATHAPGRPIDVVYLVRDGVASDEILDTAREVRADLIALGTHGRTGLRRLLAGSVAEDVLRRAPCPVLVLRSGDEAPPVAREVRTVLHATDGSEESRGALRVARELARDHGARLVLLHVGLPVDATPGVIPYPDEFKEESAMLDGLRAQLEGPDLKGTVEVEVRRGDVPKEILRAAADASCDLIVVGTHGRTGLRRLLMGSVAEAVLRAADRPVLAVRVATPTPAPAGTASH
jgi:nucleotide-binding universal stress UspA family protein